MRYTSTPRVLNDIAAGRTASSFSKVAFPLAPLSFSPALSDTAMSNIRSPSMPPAYRTGGLGTIEEFAHVTSGATFFQFSILEMSGRLPLVCVALGKAPAVQGLVPQYVPRFVKTSFSPS